MTAGCILSGYRINTTGFPTTFLTFAVITLSITVIFVAVQFYMFLQTGNQESERRMSSLSTDSENEDWSGTKRNMDSDDNDYDF